MIKKLLLSLSLFVLLGIGYTFGYGTYVEFGDPITQFGGNECTIGSDLSFNCTKAGLSLSSYDSGYDKIVTSFFWTDEGLGFYYKHTNNNTFTKQGIVNTGFYICSGDTSSINIGSSIMGGSCNNGFIKVPIGSYEDFIQFLKGKTPRLIGSGYPNSYPILFELVYDNFYFSIQLSPSNNNFRVLGVDNFIIQDMGVSGTEFNLNFSNIIKSPFGFSPSEGSFNDIMTGDYLYSNCTYSDIRVLFNTEGYNKFMCYGGLDDFSLYDSSLNYSPVPGTGLSISQIWAWSGSRAWDNFDQFFRFWDGLYNDSDGNYEAMWSSYPAVYYTYFQLYNTYRGNSLYYPDNVLQYCQLLNLPPESFSQSAGGYFKPFCETVVREKQTGIWEKRLDGTLYSGSDIPISVNWNGVGNMSGGQVYSDGSVFIQDFFNLLKSKLTNNDFGGVVGIVPGYILVFLCALLLFRFISR